ncbi:Mitochondrial presequence protease [Coelomomyces lativittatus]|nr:Mitochondrial presequence protease [Coelomomyces lativittatus]
MTRDGERLSNLMQELLFETNFENKDRLATLIARNFTTMVNTIPDAGHRYGHSLAASMVNAGSYVSDTWNGLKQIQFLHQIQSSPLEETIKVLKSIAEELLKVKPKFVLISDSEGLSSNLRTIQHFQNRYPSMASSTPLPSPFPFTPQLKNVFVPTPFPVHYCAMATSTVPYVDPHSLPLQLLAHMLSFHYLHGRVREQGGAYGARASLDAMSGVYGFTSYRDPHHQSTFHHFEHALKYDFEEGRSRGEGLDEAKLSWVGQMDHPSDVGDQGLAEIYGLSPTLQQARRDQLTHIDFNVMEEARRLWLYSSPFVKVLLGPAGLSSDYEKAGWVVQPLDFI